jgi:hypothetical protein
VVAGAGKFCSVKPPNQTFCRTDVEKRATILIFLNIRASHSSTKVDGGAAAHKADERYDRGARPTALRSD